MPWHCPRCRQPLHAERSEHLECAECHVSYVVVGGVPDLRVPGASWIDYDVDRRLACELVERFTHLSAEESARWVFSQRAEFDERTVTLRTRQVVGAVDRLQGDLDGWLKHSIVPGFVDLGCGPGMLLAAAATRGIAGIGIDVSLLWLIVAKRLIEERGGTAVLAAALAESLPLPDRSVQSVVTLDVIEHVADAPTFLGEIDRVVATGGSLAFSTPNRYSLASEPHVFVWGVGWLPRPWQAAYVKWRSGKDYRFASLLSAHEAWRLLSRGTGFEPQLIVPAVPKEEIEHFPRWKASLARLYNDLASRAALRLVLLMIGPFFQVIARKAMHTVMR